MNKEFIDALNTMAAERNLDRDQLLTSFEEALEHAFERNVMPGKNIEVSIDPETGEMEVLVVRTVVAEPNEDEDERGKEILLDEALELDPEVEIGMEMEFPVDPEQFTRIAVQTSKQMITQKIREAERTLVYEEYKDRAGEIITGVVSRVDNKRNVFVDLGRGEAIMPPREQIQGERYMVGMRLKVYVASVELGTRGPSILVSRAAGELLTYLMRQEIPEVTDGTVEIKAVAREAGARSKVAVTSNSPNVDPIGACIGHRGSRIQAVTGELQRERVDIIMWDPNPREFIRNALSPAKVGTIDLSEEQMEARVLVPEDQLSLAIGKGGQNVRLAVKLTGYKIDLEASETTSDLDAAMQAAATRQDDAYAAPDGSRARFDALFATRAQGAEEAEGTPDDIQASNEDVEAVLSEGVTPEPEPDALAEEVLGNAEDSGEDVPEHGLGDEDDETRSAS
ncbi:MAG: transcription termination factor NusA [Trueperaceae bacterium]|nr:transcription termination factor NusA [Trueperaceae bacterium]